MKLAEIGVEHCDSIHGVVSAAFGRADEAELVRRLREQTATRCWSWPPFLEHGAVLGHILFSTLTVDPGRRRSGSQRWRRFRFCRRARIQGTSVPALIPHEGLWRTAPHARFRRLRRTRRAGILLRASASGLSIPRTDASVALFRPRPIGRSNSSPECARGWGMAGDVSEGRLGNR